MESLHLQAAFFTYFSFFAMTSRLKCGDFHV